MTGMATLAILIITAVATAVAFRRPDLRDRWIFNPSAILADKQFDRMLTCGLIHADWPHFLFNAFSFYSFAKNIEVEYGARTLLLIYLASILGGSLLSLIIHRHHEYRALGASGGVCGIIFASIFLSPGSSIRMFPLPVGIPASVYAVLFLAGSFLAHRRQADNIGHDAHLGGAIVGLLVATALYPELIFAAPGLFATVLGLALLILLFLTYAPLRQLFQSDGQPGFADGGERVRRYHENQQRNQKLAEVDALLEKVSRAGMDSLSAAQRRRLKQLSLELYDRK